MSSVGSDDPRFVHRLLDKVPGMIGYWDRELRNRYANAAYIDWFGVTPDRIRGQHIRQVIGEHLFALNEPGMRAALAGVPQLFEREIVDPRGVTRRSQARYIPDVREEQVVGFFVLVTDVTDLRNAQDGLEAAQAVLEHQVAERTAELVRTNAALRETQRRLELANEQLEARVAARTGELTALNHKLNTVLSQLAAAQRITHVGSWSFSTSSGEVEWSEELFRVFGLAEGGVAPRLPEQVGLYLPDSWARLNAALELSLRTGDGYELELDVVRPSGEIRRTVARGEVLKDDQGVVFEVFGTLQDVSELAQARQARDEAAERARLATSAVQMGVWDWDVRANRLFWDSAMYALYGLDSATSVNEFEAWRASLHPDDRASAEAAVNAALAGQSKFDTAFRIVHPSGAVRFIRGTARVQHGADGTALRMIGVNWDETKQRQTELRLRANETLLQQFVVHAPAAIAMLDRNLCYLQASNRWIRDFKLTTEDPIGRCHYDVFPDIPERWKRSYERVLLGAVEGCAEDPFPRAAGGTEWLQWEARPWLQSDGSIGGLLLFTQVITDQKELELLLISQKAELERSNRDLEQFAYVASHDLQEPLRAVAGCAQLLKHNYATQLDNEADELIAHIVDGGSRMRTLIDDLLKYSRVGSHVTPLGSVNSGTAVQNALANLNVALSEASATVRVGDLPIVSADAVQLTQLFQNLISNALKYRGSSAPHIDISARSREDDWLFSVKDNGIGIQPEYFERIFVLFQRLHSRTDYPGTGIGLALCRRIVERHAGKIWVESSLGHGAEFLFSLPKQY